MTVTGYVSWQPVNLIPYRGPDKMKTQFVSQIFLYLFLEKHASRFVTVSFDTCPCLSNPSTLSLSCAKQSQTALYSAKQSQAAPSSAQQCQAAPSGRNNDIPNNSSVSPPLVGIQWYDWQFYSIWTRKTLSIYVYFILWYAKQEHICCHRICNKDVPQNLK